MYPAPSPVSSPHELKGILFVYLKILPQHHILIDPLIALFVIIVGFSLLACVLLYFLWWERQRETPAVALQHMPMPTDEMTSSEASSDEFEYQTRITMPLLEVELMPLGPPVFSCPVCLGQLVRETSTKCGRIFCRTCIKAAIRAQGKCPICRRVLTMAGLRRVYLPKTS